jgi:F0F1-type ATP synthase delta subunit
MVLNSQEIARSLWALSKKDNSEKNINHFIEYLKKTGQISLLAKAYEYLKRFGQQEKVHETLVIYSRHPLSEDSIKEIKIFVGAPDNTEITNELSDDVIGSFQASYRGVVYDGTIANALTQMSRLLES